MPNPLTTMLRACVAVSATLAACTVKLEVPPVVGVPVIAPVPAFSDTPVGSAPVVIDQAYVPLPPVAASVWLYAVPVVALGSVVVVTATGLYVVIVSACVAVRPTLFACTVKFDTPIVVGV